MLQSLSIRNVVLIDKLDLDFQSGLSVLTGETGAGKSILLDSLGLVLGKRAETSLIRCGEDKLSVTAIFDPEPNNVELQELLSENELEVDGEIIIKRTLDQNGKGKIFFNDQPISAKLLKEIGKYLVEIHGQFDNQGLLNPVNHQDVLDAFGGHGALLSDVSNAYHDYKEASATRVRAEADIVKAKEEEDNLRHWVHELEQINPRVGEEAELSAKRQELIHAEKIMESLNYAYGVLTEGRDIQSALRSAESAIDKANRYVDNKYAEIYDALDRALVEVIDAVERIESASADINLNSEEQENIDSRLFALKDLARKHGVSVDELSETLHKFQTRLTNIELGEDGINSLRKIEQEKRLIYIEAANRLHLARIETAAKLDKLVMAELPPLKMEKAKFITLIEKKEESGWSASGFNNINFTVATNPNSPQGPINKIASGGELARFMLALKVNLAQSSSVCTMIFDEVDAGVGGATAQAVGERLAKLGQSVQVLVVTHSPQVAAKGRNHFKVEKKTKDNITTTYVRELSTVEKREEIARMLAGEIITEQARAAADVLICS
ncbi:MAG: DNA repair protein RecN [Alphaproteobacteria bacterium]|nr:DNA repair protein RecN [Alphaproteobacteria bacterium]